MSIPSTRRTSEHIHETVEEGVWDQELVACVRVMSSPSATLRHQGLDTGSLLETGSLMIGTTSRRAAAGGEAQEKKP